jgi:glycosyltransferase involved in cell wall biosynthesis
VRVLYASRGYGVHDRLLVEALRATPPAGAGCEVRSLALGDDLPPGADIGAASVDTAARRVAEEVAAFVPDVTVAGPLLDVGLAAVRAGARPLLGMSWAFDLLRDAKTPGAGSVAREVLAGCDLVACDAEAVAVAAVALGADPAGIVRFPWGIDLDAFRPGGDRGLRAGLGWQERFVVLSTRSHEPVYDVPTVLEAFRVAYATNPDLRLLVVGDGSMRPELEAAVRDWGLADAVRFAGRVDHEELPAYYAAADAYVSASLVDGSSVSLLEALATAAPPIATDVGGNPEWIEPGVTGWLVPPRHPAAMARAIADASSLTPEARAGMGLAGRLVAEARADWRVNARRFVEAVERAAVAPPGRAAG